MTRPRRQPGRQGAPFSFRFEGREIPAWPGESVAAALIAAGEPVLRTSEAGDPRGLFCGIGVCWECRCTIDGVANIRACMVAAEPGMAVARQEGLG